MTAISSTISRLLALTAATCLLAGGFLFMGASEADSTIDCRDTRTFDCCIPHPRTFEIPWCKPTTTTTTEAKTTTTTSTTVAPTTTTAPVVTTTAPETTTTAHETTTTTAGPPATTAPAHPVASHPTFTG